MRQQKNRHAEKREQETLYYYHMYVLCVLVYVQGVRGFNGEYLEENKENVYVDCGTYTFRVCRNQTFVRI